MFRAVWTKTLWEFRGAILGWGLGLGTLIWLHFPLYTTLSSEATQATSQYAQTFRFYGEPVALTTPGGYATWHTLGFIPVILGIWLVLAGARLVRGDEERGSLDVLLATPQGRLRLLGEKLIGLVLALLLICLFFALGAIIGEASTPGVSVDSLGAILGGLNIGLTALIFGMLALVLSQFFVHRAAAAGIAGAVMVFAYLLNGTGRIVEGGTWMQSLSPLHYYELSKPLIPSYGTNAGAMLVLLALGVVLALVSIPLFLVRDIEGSALPTRRRSLPNVSPRAAPQPIEPILNQVSTKTVGLRSLRAQTSAILWWMVGLAAFAGYVTVEGRAMEETMRNILSTSPALAQLYSGYDVATNEGLIAVMAFTYLPGLVALFALSQAMPWSNDLERGKLEMVLSTPQARWRVILERFSTIALATLLIPLAIWATMMVAAALAGFKMGGGHLAAAVLGFLPLELIAAAFAYLLSGWLRPAAVLAIGGGMIALSYFADLLNPFLHLPDWLLALSIFHQYGNPVVEGARWGPWLIVVSIAVGFLALSTLRFQTRNIAQGT